MPGKGFRAVEIAFFCFLHLTFVYCIMTFGDYMKQTLKYSLKLFLYLIFSWFASFMVTVSFGVIVRNVNWAFYTLSELFCLIILIVLIWQTLYITGFRDSNMVRTGHRKEDLYKGFKVGAIAQLPWLALFIASLIMNMRFSIYRILNSTYWTFLTAVCGAFDSKRAANLYMRDIGVFGIVGSLLILLIVPAIAGGVYIMGYKGIDLFSKFVYKKRKEK